MKKLIVILLTLLMIVMTVSAENWNDDLLTEKTAIELLNYIQFSVSKIVNSCNKGVLEDEFSGVLNTISPASLQDNNIISAYQSLFSKLTELKLSENEKKHLLEKQEEQRKNAIFGVFNSFGSILTGTSPIQIAYVALNAGLNYTKAVNDINSATDEAEFQIGQQELKSIDSLRSDLYISSAKVFSGRTNQVLGLIPEEEMKDFAKASIIVNEESEETISTILPTLKSQMDSFSFFAPYWATLGDAYMKLSMYPSAIESYDRFEALMEGNLIFKKNPYLVNVAKNRIAIMLHQESKDYDLIEHYVQIIISNTPNVQQNLDDMHYFLCPVFEYTHNNAMALESMNYLISRGLEKKTNEGLFATYIYANCDDTNEGVKSRLITQLISNISFGYTDIEVQSFLKQKEINPGNSVFIVSSVPLIAVTTLNNKEQTKDVVFHSYDMTQQKKLYIFDKMVWSTVLQDGFQVYLDLTLLNYTITVKCQFSNQNNLDTEFTQIVSIEPVFWDKLWPGNWGKKKNSFLTIALDSVK